MFPTPSLFGVVMKLSLTASVAAIALVSLALTSETVAQEAAANGRVDRPMLSHGEPESASRHTPSAAELRQARALYRTQQRIERLERNAWLGYEPLRPGFTAVPMMSSRYYPRRVIQFPTFIYAR